MLPPKIRCSSTRISTGYNWVATSHGPFQSGGTATMAVYKVTCIAIAISQEFRSLSCLLWMLLRGNNNVRPRIITAYCPTGSASAGGAYSQQLEPLTIMKIQSDPMTQFWIDPNKETVKNMDQGKQLILMGDWNREA